MEIKGELINLNPREFFALVFKYSPDWVTIMEAALMDARHDNNSLRH